MDRNEILLLNSIKSYFQVEKNAAALAEHLVNTETRVSLRVVDWLVTNYSKKHNVAYVFTNPVDGERIFNVYLEYKSQLKSFSKNMFDPFKRGARITFEDIHGHPFETTVGQLNFFRWALKYDVIGYALEHAREIEQDMTEATKKPRDATPLLEPEALPAVQKRSHLSKMRPCNTTMLRVRVTFQ